MSHGNRTLGIVVFIVACDTRRWSGVHTVVQADRHGVCYSVTIVNKNAFGAAHIQKRDFWRRVKPPVDSSRILKLNSLCCDSIKHNANHCWMSVRDACFRLTPTSFFHVSRLLLFAPIIKTQINSSQLNQSLTLVGLKGIVSKLDYLVVEDVWSDLELIRLSRRWRLNC